MNNAAPMTLGIDLTFSLAQKPPDGEGNRLWFQIRTPPVTPSAHWSDQDEGSCPHWLLVCLTLLGTWLQGGNQCISFECHCD